MFYCSQAVKYGGIIYVSGCIGMHKETGKLDEGGVSGQTRQVMENMKSIVEAAGSSMDRVIKVVFTGTL